MERNDETGEMGNRGDLMDTGKQNCRFINRHLIGIIRDISDEQPEKVMPILQEALAKLRVSVDGWQLDTAENWVEVTTESISMFEGSE